MKKQLDAQGKLIDVLMGGAAQAKTIEAASPQAPPPTKSSGLVRQLTSQLAEMSRMQMFVKGEARIESPAVESFHHAAIHACCPAAVRPEGQPRYLRGQKALMMFGSWFIVLLQLFCVSSLLFGIKNRSCTSHSGCPRGAYCTAEMHRLWSSLSGDDVANYGECRSCSIPIANFGNAIPICFNQQVRALAAGDQLIIPAPFASPIPSAPSPTNCPPF